MFAMWTSLNHIPIKYRGLYIVHHTCLPLPSSCPQSKIVVRTTFSHLWLWMSNVLVWSWWAQFYWVLLACLLVPMLGQTNPYTSSLEARVQASNKERVYGLVCPNPNFMRTSGAFNSELSPLAALPEVGAKQLVQWFPRGKGLGIQQGTSVWVGSPKSKFHENIRHF